MSNRGSFAISTYALFDLPLKEAICHLIDDGWTTIEIMCEDKHAELLEWPSGNKASG